MICLKREINSYLNRCDVLTSDFLHHLLPHFRKISYSISERHSHEQIVHNFKQTRFNYLVSILFYNKCFKCYGLFYNLADVLFSLLCVSDINMYANKLTPVLELGSGCGRQCLHSRAATTSIAFAEWGTGKPVFHTAALHFLTPLFTPAFSQFQYSLRSRRSETLYRSVNIVFHCPTIFFNWRENRVICIVRFVPHSNVICPSNVRQ